MDYGMSSQMRYITCKLISKTHILVKFLFKQPKNQIPFGRKLLQEAVEMIKPIEDPEQAAKRLMQEAYQRGSADNITCIVVRFLTDRSNDA